MAGYAVGSGQPQCSARGPTPDLEPIPLSKVLTGDTPNVHVLMVGETRSSRGNPRKHGENMQTPRRKAPIKPKICYEATVPLNECTE